MVEELKEKVTLGDIKDAEGVFAVINNSKMPIKLAYRISKIISKFVSELKNIEESRQKLVKKYGTKDEKSENYQVGKENMEAFLKEYSELLSIESDIDIEPISYSSLLETDIKLSPSQITAIKKFLLDDTEKK